MNEKKMKFTNAKIFIDGVEIGEIESACAIISTNDIADAVDNSEYLEDMEDI